MRRMLNIMPKKQLPEDFTHTAFRVFQEDVGENLTTESDPPENPATVELGRLGGLKGGKDRAAKLTPGQRSGIALNAFKKRWGDSGALTAKPR